MDIRNSSDDYSLVHFEQFKFSGGEIHIKINPEEIRGSLHISTRLNTSDDIMQLLLAVDSLRRLNVKDISLYIPYLPYARQDRVMVSGEPLSLRVMADLINGCGFTKVNVLDVHSDVATALINNCEVINNHLHVLTILAHKKDYLLVSPDAGAAKKIFKLAKYLEYQNEIIVCEKIRDVQTGDIIRTKVDCNDLEGKNCYIVDDICDGGATFIAIAKELKLKNCGKLFLIVTHGIFSKGTEELQRYFHKIYTTNSIVEDYNSSIIQSYPVI